MARLIVTLVMLGGSAMPAHATCLASAIVEGDAALVARVRSELERRGVNQPVDPACAVTHVWVTEEDGRLRVRVEDGAGRESERVVTDETSVAILVESWSRPELTTWSAPVSMPHATPSVYVAARGELGVDVTGAAAYGASAELALPVHAYRIGVLVRALTSPDAVGPAGIDGSRLGVDVMVDAARTMHAGRIRVTPGIALGLGWLSTPGPATPSSASASTGLRTSVQLAFELPLSRLWAIELVTSGDFAPFAHEDPITDPVNKYLPGEPWLTARAGLGLRMAIW
jgi:hypothetical protein